MTRLIVLYPTPTDPEAFDRHYREIHVPLVQSLPGLVRFTVSSGVEATRGGEPYHLIAELDWVDKDAAKQASQTPAGRAVAKDVDDFLIPLCPGIRRMIYDLEEVRLIPSA
jgi:uncharacterized protein (TIGR02118 family)